jgi:two-component system nitrate/nitrite response regulator NarL
MRTLSLVVVEPLVSKLREVLASEGCELVGELSSSESIASAVAAAHARVDLAIVDLTLDGALEAVRALLSSQLGLRVLVVVPTGQPAMAVPAIRCGARGAVLEDVSDADLRSTLAYLRAGEMPIAPRVNRAMVDLLRDGDWARHPSGLTRRERDVLAHLVDGLTYADCARSLGIGTGTVQTHVKKIYEKLDVRSRAQATELAIRAGLLAS